MPGIQSRKAFAMDAHSDTSESSGFSAMALAYIARSAEDVPRVLAKAAALGAEYRRRLNGLYMATFFGAGAVGSAAGGWAFAHGGWALASAIGLTLPIAALLYFATERAPCGEPASVTR